MSFTGLKSAATQTMFKAWKLANLKAGLKIFKGHIFFLALLGIEPKISNQTN